MLDEDTPEWEHTMWILAKVRRRISHPDMYKSVEIALDDPEEWTVIELDRGVRHSEETIRLS